MGGRFSGLNNALSIVADRLRQEREMQQEIKAKQNLLGYEGLIKGTIQPTQEISEGTFEVPKLGRMKSVEQVKAVVNPVTGQIEYNIPKRSVFKPTAKPDITKTTALGIISDPIKAEQLKITYPDVYSLVESIVKDEGNGIKPDQKSPYSDYPDAFQENGVWKVMRGGKKYKIQE